MLVAPALLALAAVLPRGGGMPATLTRLVTLTRHTQPCLCVSTSATTNLTAAGLSLPRSGGAMVRGSEELMCPKAHGTSPHAVPRLLRWDVRRSEADRVCSFNRHFAEASGAYRFDSTFLREIDRDSPTVFYDSVSGKPLFVAPLGRTLDAFLAESDAHGWPSFRSAEVVWENVRVLPDGETVSVDGTHLGHNIPDSTGFRFCINLCSVAGMPPVVPTEDAVRSELRKR